MCATAAPTIPRDASPGHPRAHQGRQRALPRRRGRDIRLQVGDRLRRDRPGAGRSTSCARRSGGWTVGAVRATRSRSGREPATSRSTCCRPGRSTRRRRPTSRRGCSRRSRPTRSAGRRGHDRGHRGREPALRRRQLRPRLRPRGPAPHPRPRAGLRGVLPRAAAGRRRAFCGEPSRYGDMLAAAPKRAALPPRRYGGARSAPPSATTPQTAADTDGHALEAEVDVHAFSPGDLRDFVRGSRLRRRPRQGEELLANMHGWTMRTLEATAEPGRDPLGAGAGSPSAATWPCRGSTARLLEPCLPPAALLQPGAERAQGPRPEDQPKVNAYP